MECTIPLYISGKAVSVYFTSEQTLHFGSAVYRSNESVWSVEFWIIYLEVIQYDTGDCVILYQDTSSSENTCDSVWYRWLCHLVPGYKFRWEQLWFSVIQVTVSSCTRIQAQVFSPVTQYDTGDCVILYQDTSSGENTCDSVWYRWLCHPVPRYKFRWEHLWFSVIQVTVSSCTRIQVQVRTPVIQYDTGDCVILYQDTSSGVLTCDSVWYRWLCHLVPGYKFRWEHLWFSVIQVTVSSCTRIQA